MSAFLLTLDGAFSIQQGDEYVELLLFQVGVKFVFASSWLSWFKKEMGKIWLKIHLLVCYYSTFLCFILKSSSHLPIHLFQHFFFDCVSSSL